jgi:predicted transposase YdaD
MPIQIIETKKLPAADNIWLKNLSNDLDVKSMDSIIAESNRQGKAVQIKAYINAVLQANSQIFQEVLQMGRAKTLEQVLEESGLTVAWEARGEERGEERGKREIAQNALREGSSLEFVQRITGFDFDTVAKLQENLFAARA